MDVAAAALSPAFAASEAASSKLAENFDTFLTLLVAQLQNQDPLEPTNTKDFVQQLVQFSGVEQQIDTNSSLEKLLDFQTTNQTAAAINYMGATVQAQGRTAPLENGNAEWGYTLPENSNATLVVISDASGNVVHSAPGEITIGNHSFVWNGLDKNGQPMPDGNYTVTVTARDAESTLLEVPTSVFGRVTGVETSAEGAFLALGGVHVPLSDVLSVKETEQTPTS